MKKLRPLLLVLCIALLFSGCADFRFAASIDDLISPVSPSGENAGVQNALDEYCKSGYSIKIPSSGSYTTSFIFKDLTNDGTDEAVAFYEPSNSLGTVSMAIIQKDNDKWSVVENIEGSATDVSAVDFCDLNSDGIEEIIVCWNVISKTTGFTLNVYTHQENSLKFEPVSKPISTMRFICGDFNNDGNNELLTFSAGTSGDSPKSELYSFKNNKKRLLGSTKLDSSITSFEKITCSEIEEGLAAYADAVKSDGSSMVTELIYWSDYYDSIISPFYSYSSGKTSDTTRSNMITCMDINDDGFIEIPADVGVKGLPPELDCEEWLAYANTVLLHKCYSVSCKRDSYLIVIPDKLFSKVEYKYDAQSRKLSILSDKNVVIADIITVMKSNYSSTDMEFNGYEKISYDSGYVYLAKLYSNKDVSFNIDDVKSMIKTY